MVREKDFLYAAAGDLPKILPVLLCRELELGKRMIVQDVDVVVQRLQDVTDDPVAEEVPGAQTVLASKHPENFRAAILKNARGVTAPALGYWVSSSELDLLDDLCMTDLGWQERTNIEARVLGGRGPRGRMTVAVVGHVLLGEQASEPYSHNNRFEHELLTPSVLAVAAEVREGHLAEIAASQVD